MKTTFFLLLTAVLSSCSSYYLKRGDAYYESMQYDKAINSYTKYVSKTNSNSASAKLADCYRLNSDYVNAEKWYARAITQEGSAPENLFFYGKALMNNRKYAEAKKAFEAYRLQKPEDPLAPEFIASCDASLKHVADSTLYGLKQVDIPQITTAFAEVNYRDGIVFAADKQEISGKEKRSGWTGRSYLDLYFSKKESNGTWSVPEPLPGEINGLYHEGPSVFNNDQTLVYFTRSNYSSARKLGKNEKDESNLKIFSATLVDGKWTSLQMLPFNSDEYSCGHPALSPDGKTLYFVSDMPAGAGGTDIYKCTLSKNKEGVDEWSQPENLGEAINTAGNEMFPYISREGILYFSSEAHNTFGGLDIFSSAWDGKSWSEPEHLQYPINTSEDDFALVLNKDGRTGYISSNRSDLDKIYEIRLPDPVFLLKGTVTAKENGSPLGDAVVELTLPGSNLAEVWPVNDDGSYAIKLKAEQAYKVQAMAEGYLVPAEVAVSTEGRKKSDTLVVNFQLEKMQMEKPIVLENIYYDLDKWKIRKDAAVELDKFAELLNNNPQINVELSAHTDARADDHYNLVLSEKRAKAAVEYLVKKGIAPSRLQWKGYGETMLVNNCGNGVSCEEQLHQQNRRTEFRIIKINEVASGQ
jgi:peptidoglycan-associated lipoprotein